MKHGTDSHATEKRTLDISKMDKTEWETSKILSKILNRRELDKVAPDTVKKIEKFFEERFDEYLTTQALYETLQRTHCKLFVANIFFSVSFCLHTLHSLQNAIDTRKNITNAIFVVTLHSGYARFVNRIFFVHFSEDK